MNTRMWAASGDAGERRDAARSRRRARRARPRASSRRARRAVGRMAEPEEIAARIEELLGAAAGRAAARQARARLRGRDARAARHRPLRRQPLVRTHGCRARRGGAEQRGADVTLLAANLAVPAPPGVSVVETPTAADLEREALARADSDVDRHGRRRRRLPARVDPSTTKRPKDGAPWTVELEPTRGRPRRSRRRAPAGAGARRLRGGRSGPGLERAREKRAGEERRPLRVQRREPGGHRLRRGRERGRPASRAPESARSRRRRSV